jgi:hypothetical protein
MKYNLILTCQQVSSKFVLVANKVNVRCLAHDEWVPVLEWVAPYKASNKIKLARQHHCSPRGSHNSRMHHEHTDLQSVSGAVGAMCLHTTVLAAISKRSSLFTYL